MASNKHDSNKVPATRVMHEVLVKAGTALTTAEIVKRTLADKRVHPKGSTPEVTLAAVLYKVAGQGRLFKRVGVGKFKAIADRNPAPAPARKTTSVSKSRVQVTPRPKPGASKKTSSRKRSSARSRA